MNVSHEVLIRRLLVIIALAGTSAILPQSLLAGQDIQGQTANDYKIGPNDLLEIKVFELPDLNQTVRVSEDGSITFMLLGNIEVAGYTAHGLELKLATLLTEKYVPKGAHVSVFIREFQKISVVGAVVRPGMYELVGPTTLLMAIAQAGGLTAQAMPEIYVYRTGADGRQEITAVSLSDLASNAGQDQNILLQPKDQIMIPIDQTLNVFVYGEVKTPGVISYLGSKHITLLQAIAQAGGTTEWAKKSKIVIKRRDKVTGKEMKINVDLKKMMAGQVSDIILEEGDIVIVP